MTLNELLARWDSDEGKPFKGQLIDFKAYEKNPTNIGCMCAQGQVLHLLGGWTPERLSFTYQDVSDKASAELLNISVAHSVLLRKVNDKVDGAPSIVLTHPEKVLGDQAKTVLAFWLHIDRMSSEQQSTFMAASGKASQSPRDTPQAKAWSARMVASGNTPRSAAWVAAETTVYGAAGITAGTFARNVTRNAIGISVWNTIEKVAKTAGSDYRTIVRATTEAAAGACSEIQGAALLRERGKPFYFLPMFGFSGPETIPPLPADYGLPSDA